MSESSKRIQYIDSLKGLAIILVVIGHITKGTVDAGIECEFYRQIKIFIYLFHMPLFFVISGFVFYTAYFKDRCIKGFVTLNQTINLYIVYLLYEFIFVFAKLPFQEIVNNPVTYRDFLLAPIQPTMLMWYIFVLVIYYIIFSINAVRDLKPAIMLPILAVFTLISEYIISTEIFALNKVLYNMIFFYIGILLAKNGKSVFHSAYIAIPYGSLSLISSVIFMNSINKNHILKALVAVGISLFLFYLFKTIPILSKEKVLSYTGLFSLEIYLLHTYILTALRALCLKYNVFFDSTLGLILFLIISTIAGTFIPILIAKLLEALKLRALFFAPYKFIRKKKTSH